VEHEDRVQRGEFRARSPEVQPDDDGVEDDAELEDQEGGDLLLEGALVGRRGGGVVAELLEVVLGALVGGIGSGFVSADAVLLVAGVEGLVAFVVVASGDEAFDVGVAVRVAVFDFDVTLGSKVEEEDEHYGAEDYAGDPGVAGPTAGHADACLGPDLAVSGVEETVSLG